MNGVEMKKNKILILGGREYSLPFIKHGEIVCACAIKECRLIVFTGGSDVSPYLYNETKNIHTHANMDRDIDESNTFKAALHYGIPMVGICRGAQFLTVMSGGSLYQHVTNHAIRGTHSIEDINGNKILVTSTHHQMMNPKQIENHELIAWAYPSRSTVYLNGLDENNMKIPEKEPEVVWYPNTKSLAVQFHPEYMPTDSDGSKYFQQLLSTFVLQSNNIKEI